MYNVHWPALAAGTTRLQLLHKGDFDYTYTNLANILPMTGILFIGIIAWLLDKKVRQPLAPLRIDCA